MDSDGFVLPGSFVYDNIKRMYFVFFSVSIFCPCIFHDFVPETPSQAGVRICIENQWILSKYPWLAWDLRGGYEIEKIHGRKLIIIRLEYKNFNI